MVLMSVGRKKGQWHSVGGYQGIRTVEELNPDGSDTAQNQVGRPIFETDLVRASSTSQNIADSSPKHRLGPSCLTLHADRFGRELHASTEHVQRSGLRYKLECSRI